MYIQIAIKKHQGLKCTCKVHKSHYSMMYSYEMKSISCSNSDENTIFFFFQYKKAYTELK